MSIRQELKEDLKEVVKEMVKSQMREEMETMTRRMKEMEKKWKREREEMRDKIEEFERRRKEEEEERRKEREGKDNDKNVDYQEEERVVIDAVHERFRRRDNIMYIRCDDCDSRIPWDDSAIRNHFNNLHPSNSHCYYCKGKVFIYQKVIIMDGKETLDEIVYHKCDYNQQAEISA